MQLDFTGERLVPGEISEVGALYIEHITRYMFTEEYVKNKCVLDAGCGCGYGAALISKYAKKVVGVDISKDAIKFCKDSYSKNNNEFYQMDCCNISLPDKTFDVITSFEFIEHIKDQSKFLKEISRLLKAEGLFIISTPNKAKHTCAKNPFHLSELDIDEFNELLSGHFKNIKIYGQKISKIFQLQRKIFFIQEELAELDSAMQHLPLFFVKSFIPKWVKRTVKKMMNNKNKTEQLSKSKKITNFPMSINDIEISERNIADSEYLIAVCEKS